MPTQQQPGLIQKAQSDAAPKFDHSAEIEKMVAAMPPEMRDGFESIVEAGKQIMYGSETRDIVQQFLGADAPVEEKLGAGVANLVIMIDNQANGNVPKELLIPAGTVLLFDAADVLREAGETISAAQIGSAYEHMFYGIFAGYGASPEQTDAVFEDMGKRQSQETPEQEAQESPQQEAREPQQEEDQEAQRGGM